MVVILRGLLGESGVAFAIWWEGLHSVLMDGSSDGRGGRYIISAALDSTCSLCIYCVYVDEKPAEIKGKGGGEGEARMLFQGNGTELEPMTY